MLLKQQPIIEHFTVEENNSYMESAECSASIMNTDSDDSSDDIINSSDDANDADNYEAILICGLKNDLKDIALDKNMSLATLSSVLRALNIYTTGSYGASSVRDEPTDRKLDNGCDSKRVGIISTRKIYSHSTVQNTRRSTRADGRSHICQ